MKRLILAAAAVITALMVSGTAMAVGTNTMTVSASVLGTCKFSAATSTLAFGVLDPSSPADATSSVGVNFWCTRGASYTISDDDGLNETGLNANRMQHAVNPVEYIPYSISYTATGTGSGATTPIALTVNGTVTNANYVDALEGNYSDTVVLTVNP